jgi:hypothetical protein
MSKFESEKDVITMKRCRCEVELKRVMVCEDCMMVCEGVRSE